MVWAGNTKGGSITVLLSSYLTGLDQSVLQIKTKIVSRHTADSKPVKQEVNCTLILPPLVFPGLGHLSRFSESGTTEKLINIEHLFTRNICLQFHCCPHQAQYYTYQKLIFCK